MKPSESTHDMQVNNSASLACKVITSAVASIYPFLAQARADIDFDMDGSGQHAWMFPILCGIFGAMTCHEHKALIHEHSEIVNHLLKWVFRVAIILIALPIIGNFVGFYFDKDTGISLLSAWGVGKAGQGLYISGVAAGKQHS